jgi:hypothetical protein
MKTVKYQRGISLTSLMVGAGVLFCLSLVAMKVAPAWIEYGAVKKAVLATAQDISLKDATVSQVRASFTKRAEIDSIKSITGEDLDITKDGNGLVIEFAYAQKIPMGANVSIVFDFAGSSVGKSNGE